MKNILVTGGAGFIGSNFVRFLQAYEKDVQVINLDALTYAGSLLNLEDIPDLDRHIFIRGDICDRSLVDDILHQYSIDTIVHFAAETHVDRSILGPGQFIQTNVIGTYTLLEAARQSWMVDHTVPMDMVRFHHVSTDEVFGTLSPDDPPFNEETAYSPRSPYAASKAASDHLVRAYHHTYGLPVTISNCTNNYGPYQFPEKLIPLMILHARDGKPLPVYGDGQQVRDWLFVDDHCEAIWKILREGKIGQTYAIGGDNQPANLVIVETICEIMDEVSGNSPHVPHRQLIQFVADRPGHDRRYDMDITKIRTELGWEPRQTLTTGLVQTVQWYLDHPDWVESVSRQADYQGWLQQNYESRGRQG
ncbi:MAG TPA: dTDP-glucose 4,6-dehydratase [Anaerolineaceae bacterium]|nr:dTDP-glucose 4,6-dehydratase [Anaerolineaceae bacterium]HQJ03236.1 dTDP-glucose 4,6-dehydratase [Anaerolineaceae bacterium]